MEKLRIASSVMPDLPEDKVEKLFQMGYDIVLDGEWAHMKKHPVRTLIYESEHYPELFVDDLWSNGKEKEDIYFEAPGLTAIFDLLKIEYVVDEIEPHSLLPFDIAVRSKHLPRIDGLEN